MSSTLPDATRQFVRERADYLCEYCKSAELLTGLKCEVDHITPSSRGGTDELSNLCAAYTFCNSRKYTKIDGVDPETLQNVPLYNPRKQVWNEHLRWGFDGTNILGVTATGRATVDALQLNDPLRVAARSLWVLTGRHPPR